jgi:magnesium transporter
MTYEVLAADLRDALGRGERDSIAEFVASQHAADLADILSEIEPHEAWEVLSTTSPERRAEVFGYLDSTAQAELASVLTRSELADLVSHMEADERADLFNRLPPERQDDLLPALAQAEREDVRRLASYAEDTAGSIMTSDYAALAPELTAEQAIEKLRQEAPDKETIYQSYVIDSERRLLGAVSLQDLILARPQTRVEEIMKRDAAFASVNDDQQEVARTIARYDLIALPVVDGQHRLVGIVTHDDAIDVLEREATEDFHKSATVGRIAGSLRDVRLFTLYRTRVLWLVLLVFGNLFSGAGIAFFEDTIAAHVVLVFFLPLLIDSGGNAGSQAATLAVRALATGEVALRDFATILGRELLVSAALGATMALAVSGIGLVRGGPLVAFVVALSMAAVVILGSLVGMSLPFVLNRLGLDPAAASAPLVTSIIDAVGVVLYFGLATTLLGMSP